MDQRPHAKSRGLTGGPRLCLEGTLFHLARASKKRLELGVQGNSGAGAAAFPGRRARRQGLGGWSGWSLRSKVFSVTQAGSGLLMVAGPGLGICRQPDGPSSCRRPQICGKRGKCISREGKEQVMGRKKASGTVQMAVCVPLALQTSPSFSLRKQMPWARSCP